MMPLVLAHGGASAGGFPPLHPIFVNFTAALIPVSLGLDLAARLSRRAGLREAGWWTLLIAACITPFTVLLGWLWMRSMADMDHWQMSYHKWLGTALGAAFILQVVWRGRLHARGLWPGFAYFAVATLLFFGLLAQGDLGGSMSFGRGIVIAGEGHHAHTDEDHDNSHHVDGEAHEHHETAAPTRPTTR